MNLKPGYFPDLLRFNNEYYYMKREGDKRFQPSPKSKNEAGLDLDEVESYLIKCLCFKRLGLYDYLRTQPELKP